MFFTKTAIAAGSMTLCLIAGGLLSAQVTERTEPACSHVILRLDKPGAVIVLQPRNLRYDVLALAEGKQAIVFSTANYREIAIVVVSNNIDQGFPDTHQFFIRVEGGPNPNPGPEPEPEPELGKIGKQVRDEGRKAGIPSSTAKLYAGNYEAVSSKLAAVSSMTVQEASLELREMNQRLGQTHPLPSKARALVAQVERYFKTEVGEDRQKAIDSLSQIAKGFEAI